MNEQNYNINDDIWLRRWDETRHWGSRKKKDNFKHPIVKLCFSLFLTIKRIIILNMHIYISLTDRAARWIWKKKNVLSHELMFSIKQLLFLV